MQLIMVRICLREAVFTELSKVPLSLEVGSSGTMHGPKTEQRLEVRGLIPLSVVLNLKKMQKSSCIIDAIFDQVLPKDTKLTKSKMKDIFSDNQAVIGLFLDGLDEIPTDVLESSDGMYTIKDVLHNKVLRKSYVMVTTRPHMVDYIFNSYKYYAVSSN